MGTFAAGHMLDPYTGRPVVAQVVKVLAWPTDLPVTPDGGPIATGARGGYGQFTVPDLDAVSLVASDGTTVGPLASVEAQLAAGNAGHNHDDRYTRHIVLDEGEPVPPGTPDGTLILRRAPTTPGKGSGGVDGGRTPIAPLDGSR